MRPLLSTRLFDAGPLRPPELRLARRKGFSGLEIFAGRHLDIHDPSAASAVRTLADGAGLSAEWLFLPPDTLGRINDEPSRARFSRFVRALGTHIVAARASGFGGGGPDPDRLRIAVELAGARLALDSSHVQESLLRRLLPDIGFCWDIALEERPAVDDALGRTARGRLLGVRVGHDQDGHRAVPGPAEASVLEEVWARQAPGYLVYDVEDPAGFGGLADIEDVLESLRAFHCGEGRKHPESSGGVFWAALAPG